MNIQSLFQNGGGPAPSCRAIEIGTSAVRMAAVKRSGRNIRLVDYREAAIPRSGPGPAPEEAVREQLRSLARGGRFREEVIATALPLRLTFIRTLEVPFTKVAQIRQVIAAEAELHVPFPLEEVIIDFWPVAELPEGKTRVMMAAVKKSVLADHLRLLSEAGITPARVNLDLLGSCRALVDSPRIDPGEVTLLLDIGAGHTGAAFLLGGRVVFVRSISWGGDSLTAALAAESGVGFAEAEALKLSSSAGTPGGPPPAAYETLGTELLRTIPSAGPATGGLPPRNLILAGGASGAPGLGEYLAAKTGLQLLEADPYYDLRVRRSSPGPGGCAAVGLAMGEVAPNPDRLDFRREEFAYAGAWKKIRLRLYLTGFLVAGLLTLLALSFFWRIGMEEKEIRNLDRRIRQIVRLTFPDAPVPVPGQELRVMEEELAKAEEELQFYRELGSVSALDVLREISRVIPEELRVQVVVMDIDDRRVLFRGRTNNYRSAELIKNALAQSDYFEGDRIRETRDSQTLTKGGQLVTVEFEYNIPLTPRAGGR